MVGHSCGQNCPVSSLESPVLLLIVDSHSPALHRLLPPQQILRPKHFALPPASVAQVLAPSSFDIVRDHHEDQKSTTGQTSFVAIALEYIMSSRS